MREHREHSPDHRDLGPDPELLTDERLARILVADRRTAAILPITAATPHSERPATKAA